MSKQFCKVTIDLAVATAEDQQYYQYFMDKQTFDTFLGMLKNESFVKVPGSFGFLPKENFGNKIYKLRHDVNIDLFVNPSLVCDLYVEYVEVEKQS